MIHSHAVPVWGCSDCLTEDKSAWAEKTYAAWKSTYKIPKCAGCGTTMIHYGKNSYPSKLEALLICPAQDEDGAAFCNEDSDLTLVIG